MESHYAFANGEYDGDSHAAASPFICSGVLAASLLLRLWFEVVVGVRAIELANLQMWSVNGMM